MTKKYIRLNSWNRKNIFDHFIKFEEPFHSVVVDIDCTRLFKYCKDSKSSFFAHYLHKSLVAVNSLIPFKYRLEGKNKVALYEIIHASATISRPDNTFGFSHILFDKDYQLFKDNIDRETERIVNSNDLFPNQSYDNVIHYSSLPWIKFTALTHARQYAKVDSVPKITFGKVHEYKRQMMLPVSIHVNHALVDGYDVANYISIYQDLLINY